MIPVSAALDQLFQLVTTVGTEEVPLAKANGRVLRADAVARRDQPPFDGSAMDGYAVKNAEAVPGARLTVIGESAAGHGFADTVGAGQAVRIFTGAPVPAGTDRVIIQEDVSRDGDTITLGDTLDQGHHIRPRGVDFADGSALTAPRLLRPADIALLAAMNIPAVTVSRRPTVALISTGDELVMPGGTPGPDQIMVSNTFGLAALLRDLGAAPRMLPIARDTQPSLEMAFELAADADLVVTIGGASVGDHDLVGKVAADLGMARSFYKVAMRPGKPLMAGRLKSGAMMVGLPGNPVSAMVCGHVFLAPVLRGFLGLPMGPAPRRRAPLAADLAANGPREHYMRGTLTEGAVSLAAQQDSSLLSVLSSANVLVIRPPSAPAVPAGTMVDYIEI
ncbi:molybdopterin molybdotransferase MoeA [Cognatishimia sp. SS12]|uniref:molybdopterin molybdotransferase MoeA n=1 Tax=Cognatishimia sp. SS12 TaxID=2979465 RepID=UPI00232C2582|nr:gephyrin-like molybdotransferase Glp [Cognatishimia sp. SS12]MDC0737444.1 molybdopterin molybdotransferase MoeA [Cognatishimia sp. SS12]